MGSAAVMACTASYPAHVPVHARARACVAGLCARRSTMTSSWAALCLRMLAPQDLDPLASLPKLQMLSLMGNPVALKSQYRCGADGVTRPLCLVCSAVCSSIRRWQTMPEQQQQSRVRHKQPWCRGGEVTYICACM